jgi:DNA-directed RNA polymerase subunit RPC12/RpoP
VRRVQTDQKKEDAMLIYKCADCNRISLTENRFRCLLCGGHLVGFKRPSIEPQPSRVDLKRILYGIGVGCLFVGIGAFVFLGFIFEG